MCDVIRERKRKKKVKKLKKWQSRTNFDPFKRVFRIEQNNTNNSA